MLENLDMATGILDIGSQRVNKQSEDSRWDWGRLFPTQFISNLWKNRKIVVPCWLQQSFQPINTFITEWCAEARPFRRLSKHLFRMQ